MPQTNTLLEITGVRENLSLLETFTKPSQIPQHTFLLIRTPLDNRLDFISPLDLAGGFENFGKDRLINLDKGGIANLAVWCDPPVKFFTLDDGFNNLHPVHRTERDMSWCNFDFAEHSAKFIQDQRLSYVFGSNYHFVIGKGILKATTTESGVTRLNIINLANCIYSITKPQEAITHVSVLKLAGKKIANEFSYDEILTGYTKSIFGSPFK